jgi:hypothetical protein
MRRTHLRQSGSSLVETLLLVGFVTLMIVAGGEMYGKTVTSRVCSAASQLAAAGLNTPPQTKKPPASTFGGGTCSTTNTKGGGSTDISIPNPDVSPVIEEM